MIFEYTVKTYGYNLTNLFLTVHYELLVKTIFKNYSIFDLFCIDYNSLKTIIKKVVHKKVRQGFKMIS